MKKYSLYTLLLVIFMSMAQPSIGEENLAKKSQNPVGDIISLPIEYRHFGDMADGAAADSITMKPVYPVRIKNLNLINRFIIPYLGIDKVADDVDLGGIYIPETTSRESGFGNIQYQGYFTPASPGKVIWGLGPAFEFPTNSNGLGSDMYSAGPAAVLLSTPGNWVFGATLQNIWSFAGPSDEESVNQLTFQYFINYNFGNGWYLTTSPVMTADWNKSSGDQWTVPIGGGIGKLVRFGQQPVDFKLQAYSNVEVPAGGPDWSMMFAIKFLFPK